MRILLVEDDVRIAREIAATLQAAGYMVESVGDGEEAWFRGETEEYDLIILDLGLPRMDGLSVLKRWRSAGRLVPVLVLTARGTWPERVEGINAGADDYLPKPFQMEEMLARVRALIRRSAGFGASVIESGPISLDTPTMRVTLNGSPVALSPLEYRLLAYLMHHKGRVVPGPELLEHLYGAGDTHEANALEAVVARLRRKLGAKAIKTRRGFGYSMSGPAA
jgi:two-component system, OmpR family, response regulator